MRDQPLPKEHSMQDFLIALTGLIGVGATVNVLAELITKKI